MPAPVTMESVTADAIDLVSNLNSVVRSILSDIADLERRDRRRSKRDRAISRWQIYLGVMLVQAAEGVVTLTGTKNVRAIEILGRSMFEYQQKAEYFLTHRKEAFEQYGSIGARQFVELSKLPHPDPNVLTEITAAFLEWKRTSGNRNERSGDVKLARLHLQNVKDKSVIKTDKEGTEYTEEFQAEYGFPSLYVHGEPLLMPEVFRHPNDDSEWDFREDVTYRDALSGLITAYTHMIKFCAKTSKAYNLDYERVRALRTQIWRVLNTSNEARGRPFRISRVPSRVNPQLCEYHLEGQPGTT